jgi:hypothetical protein
LVLQKDAERSNAGGHAAPMWLVFLRVQSRARFPVAFAIAVLMTSCDSNSSNPQLDSGWVTNCAGPAFIRFSQDGRPGPGPDRPVFRINDQLVLAVPKKNQPVANSIDRPPAECKDVRDLPPAGFLFFAFSGHWSSGYKAEDVPSIGGESVHPDLVTVRIQPEVPSTFSAEEQQKIAQILREQQRNFSEGPREIGGLTCFVPKMRSFPYIACSGSRPGDSDVVKLRFKQVSASFVLLQANYASSRYGGIHVYWQTTTSEVSHWREVEEEIWRLLTDWNVLSNNGANGEPR